MIDCSTLPPPQIQLKIILSVAKQTHSFNTTSVQESFCCDEVSTEW